MQAEYKLKLEDGPVHVPGRKRDGGQQFMGIQMQRVMPKQMFEPLDGLGWTAKSHEQLGRRQQCFWIFRRFTQDAIEHSHRLVGTPGFGQNPRKATSHLGQIWFDPDGFAEAPLGSLPRTLLHQHSAHRQQTQWTGCLQRPLGEVEVRFGLLEVAEPHAGLDHPGVRLFDGGIEPQSSSIPRSGTLPGLQSEADGAGGEQGVQLVGRQTGRSLETIQGFLIPVARLERQTEIELPVGLIGVDLQSLPQLVFGFGQLAAIKELEGSICMLLGSLPIIHGGRIPAQGAVNTIPAFDTAL